MDGLLKTVNEIENENEFSFKNFFVPLTTFKAITWIVIIGIIVYANMLFNGFVLDDKTYIILNPDLHTLNLLTLIKENIFNSNVTGQYDPIAAIYFAYIYSMTSDSQFLYHFFQVTMHVTNACLFFLVLKKVIDKKTSFFLSLIFLIHPIQTEAVSYIAATGVVLFFLFGILALLLTINNKLNTKRIILINILLVLSLLTKETGILFLFIVLSYHFIFQKGKRILFIIL